jgi:hypothetical protein
MQPFCPLWVFLETGQGRAGSDPLRLPLGGMHQQPAGMASIKAGKHLIAGHRRPALELMRNLSPWDSRGEIKWQVRGFDWRRTAALDLPLPEFFQSPFGGLRRLDQILHGLV